MTNSKPSGESSNPSSRETISEISEILSTAIIRSRTKQLQQEKEKKLENRLEDVAERGKLRTAENLTLEKGAYLQ